MHFSLPLNPNFGFFFLPFAESAWADSTIRCEIRKPMNWNATSDRYVPQLYKYVKTNRHTKHSVIWICKTWKIIVCSLPPAANRLIKIWKKKTIKQNKKKKQLKIDKDGKQQQWWSALAAAVRCKYLWQNPFHIFYRFQTICCAVFVFNSLEQFLPLPPSDAAEFIFFHICFVPAVCVCVCGCVWNGSMCSAGRVTWKRKMKAIVVWIFEIRLWSVPMERFSLFLSCIWRCQFIFYGFLMHALEK